MEKTFTLTEEHIKLLAKMHVTWQEAETGAPEINPKRPYGNSNVELDIHEILTGERVDELDENLEKTYKELHKEMKDALQIVLDTTSFVPGVYKKEEFGESWERRE